MRALTSTAADVERLWEVCQIPDYRKIAPANHAELAVTVYGFLMREGKIEADWFARQIEFADHTDGDIDTLSTRIAHIRTWTFAAGAMRGSSPSKPIRRKRDFRTFLRRASGRSQPRFPRGRLSDTPIPMIIYPTVVARLFAPQRLW